MHLLLANNSASGGGAAPTFEHIATTTLIDNATTSVTFSSIPQNYTHLQLRISAKYFPSGTAYMYMSTNISSTYYTQGMETGASSFSSFDQSAASRYENLGLMVGNAYTHRTSFIIDILDYSNSSKKKVIKNFAGYKREGADAHSYMILTSGFQDSTSNISSLTFFNSGGAAFRIRSRFSLYGIKVA